MADKKLANLNVLMIIAPKDFRDEELLEPKKLLEDSGANVTIASTELTEAQGMLGAKVKPDILIDNVNASSFAAAIVVGGMGSPEYLWNNKKIHSILQELYKANKVVAGICLSGAVLAKAQVLKGKKATVWATDESLQALSEGQATYLKEHVVEDGNIITADGPEAAEKFGTTLINAICKLTSRV
jgi:protease I